MPDRTLYKRIIFAIDRATGVRLTPRRILLVCLGLLAFMIASRFWNMFTLQELIGCYNRSRGCNDGIDYYVLQRFYIAFGDWRDYVVMLSGLAVYVAVYIGYVAVEKVLGLFRTRRQR